MTSVRRDDQEVAALLARWWTARDPARGTVTVTELERPTAGWSNETFLVVLDHGGHAERAVLRLPALLHAFPTYDLTAQAAVHRALRDTGIPAPAPVAVELDEAWLGAPFFVMERAEGRAVDEVTGLDPWVANLGEAGQRAVHEAFFSLLAHVHRLDWRAAGLDQHLRGAGADLGDEVRWWIDYAGWSADGSPGARLSALLGWCQATAPAVTVPASLCWGDARLGNVLFDDHGAITSVLDWELATIGPAEMDLAWYLALERLTAKVAGGPVPGFLDRTGAVARYESALGRRTEHLAWHEVFALVRSTAVHDRLARLASAAGLDYPGVPGDDNPILGYIEHQVERHEALDGDR